MILETPENLWKPEYLLDVESMDIQHKHFFQILDVLSKLCSLINKDNIKNHHLITILSEIRTYVLKHFHDEETMLQKYKYPDLLDQCHEHDKFMKYMIDYTNEKIQIYTIKRDDAISSDTAALMADLHGYIAGWWGEHILKKDAMYVDHVKKHKKVLSCK